MISYLEKIKGRLCELGSYDPRNPHPSEVGRAVKRFQIANNLIDGDPNGLNHRITHGACCHVTHKALWPTAPHKADTPLGL
jgi:hypothetical protein